jgi:hypothetical protein
MSVLKRPEKTRRAATMDKKRLENYLKKLQARREELLKSIARTEEEGRAADDDPTDWPTRPQFYQGISIG